MAAPKGNRNAAKDNPKVALCAFKIRPDNLKILKRIAKDEKISLAQLIEKSLLASYPKEFDGKF